MGCQKTLPIQSYGAVSHYSVTLCGCAWARGCPPSFKDRLRIASTIAAATTGFDRFSERRWCVVTGNLECFAHGEPLKNVVFRPDQRSGRICKRGSSIQTYCCIRPTIKINPEFASCSVHGEAGAEGGEKAKSRRPGVELQWMYRSGPPSVSPRHAALALATGLLCGVAKLGDLAGGVRGRRDTSSQLHLRA